MTGALAPPERLRYVNAVRQPNGRIALYYRRDGRRSPLPGPEGSQEFLAAYDRATVAYEAGYTAPRAATVAGAIATYRSSAAYRGLAPKTRSSSYDVPLALLTERLGTQPLADVTPAVTAAIRRLLADDPLRWNRLRSVGVLVWRAWHEADAPGARDPVPCPWTPVRRLPVADSDQNRPWPSDVLRAALAAATPEFRALLLTLLLTGQRLGDVCRLPVDAWDQSRGTLTLRQQKTGAPLILGVPPVLAAAWAGTIGRAAGGQLLCTPRRRNWTTLNAQETWLTLRKNLGLGRYTLHGLRATGVSALSTAGGWDARALMALTGHTTERNLNLYLRGASTAPAAARAASAVADLFAAALPTNGNARKFSGVTGRAAAKSRDASPTDNGVATGNSMRGRSEKI